MTSLILILLQLCICCFQSQLQTAATQAATMLRNDTTAAIQNCLEALLLAAVARLLASVAKSYPSLALPHILDIAAVCKA